MRPKMDLITQVLKDSCGPWMDLEVCKALIEGESAFWQWLGAGGVS